MRQFDITTEGISEPVFNRTNKSLKKNRKKEDRGYMFFLIFIIAELLLWVLMTGYLLFEAFM